MNTPDSIISDIPKGLVAWIQFNIEDRILYVGEETDPVAGYLNELCKKGSVKCTQISISKDINNYSVDNVLFDVIISISDIETAGNPVDYIHNLKKLLAPSGRLYIAANNRLGIRYFCGDRDKYTGRNFDGIENYRRYAVKKEDVLTGRMYDKAELIDMLDSAGIKNRKFYSVFPNLEHPSMLFSENYVPNEELNTRVFPMYDNPDTVFLEEEFLYNDLIKNGMFHTMANAFLIECCLDDKQLLSDVEHVTMSLDRGREDALLTIIRNDKTVEKKAVYNEGVDRLGILVENSRYLNERKIKTVTAKLDGNSYVMPYIEAETALAYLRRLSQESEDAYINAMDRFYNIIMKSSDIYKKVDDSSAIHKEIEYFKKGYIDLVPLNCFVVDDEFVFYDQEFVIDDCMVSALVVRLIDLVYIGNFELERIIPRSFFFERYGISDEVDEARRIGNKFLEKLRKEKELAVYHNRFRRNYETVNSNRQRMNYSDMEYQQRFVDIFKNLGDKKLVLFGSGNFTKRFIAMYGKDYDLDSIIDNNETRWGQFIDGIEIKSPGYLAELPKDKYKVIICIKSYLSVAKQLEAMGFNDYGVFDSARSYPKAIQNIANIQREVTDEPKKYRVGYVAGVFDMFHVGHINLLKKAKEQCEYLIVGVVPDEDVFNQKNKKPIISCEDRVAVLNSCKYVDKAEALPVGFGGIRDAHKMYQFDVMFSGDDHGDEGYWIADKEYLNKHGADLIFFKYTEGVSSTKIRQMI